MPCKGEPSGRVAHHFKNHDTGEKQGRYNRNLENNEKVTTRRCHFPSNKMAKIKNTEKKETTEKTKRWQGV